MQPPDAAPPSDPARPPDPDRPPDPAGLLPHAGTMRLIGAVLAWDDRTIVCETNTHRDPACPLRLGDRLPAVCGLEFGAQAMAIHGALRAARAAPPRMGLLVAAHELVWHRERLDDLDGAIEIGADCLLASGNQVAYSFWLRSAGCGELLRGRASVVLSA